MGRDFTTTLLGFLIIALGFAVQLAGYVNLDNAWLLHVAERVVGAEQLGRQVIESNPPLIVYIMEIPVYIAQTLNISLVHGFDLFMFLLILASLSLIKRHVNDRGVFLCIVFAVSVLPAWAFGEREHIFILLILPYFVSLWNDKKFPLWFIIISALMAGVGIALKPFFLLIWAVLVLTKMVLDKRFWSFINVQNIIIGLVVVAYVAYLFFIEKVYINEIFPLLVKYYGGFNGNAKDVYSQSIQLAILSQIAFWIVFIKDRKLLTRAIYLANFANLASVLLIIIQAKTWMNYFYPPNFFGFVSNALITAVLFSDLKPLWNKVASFISSFILMVFLTIAISTNLKIGLRVNEDVTEDIIKVFNQYADGKPVYILTFDLGTIFPAILYTNAKYHGRYGHFWSLPGMYSNGEVKDDELVYHQPGQRLDDETRLIAQVMGDIANNPPEIIVVMDSSYYSRTIGDYKFDFVKYFSIEPEFAEMWENYEKIKTIGNYDIYKRQN